MKFGEKRGEVIRMDTYNMIDFNEKKGFICDMDGVIYHGNRVLRAWPSSSSGCTMKTRNTCF